MFPVSGCLAAGFGPWSQRNFLNTKNMNAFTADLTHRAPLCWAGAGLNRLIQTTQYSPLSGKTAEYQAPTKHQHSGYREKLFHKVYLITCLNLKCVSYHIYEFAYFATSLLHQILDYLYNKQSIPSKNKKPIKYIHLFSNYLHLHNTCLQ